MRKQNFFPYLRALLRLLYVTVFLSGCCSSSSQEPDESAYVANESLAQYNDLALFTEALLLINRYYVDESDFTGLVYSAINGMVTDLDPHSSFLAPESLKSLNESTKGSFVGIGINVESDSSGVKVIAPLEDSPALKAGIKAGDTITAVDGHSLQGVTLGEAVGEMRGKKGSKVAVTVKRVDGSSEDVELVRNDIHLSCIDSSCKLDEQTGFLRIRQFTSSTVEEVQEALKALEDQGIEQMILDLRDNPGGVLSSAIGVSELFLEKGDPVVRLKSRAGDKKERNYKSGGGYKFPDIPLALLVNHGSASASEIVAGALRSNQRAVIIGERTYGKASVQSVIKMSLRPECAVRLTTGYYYTPDGELIHGRGIVPDKEVSLTYTQQEAVKKHFQLSAYRQGDIVIPEDDLQLAEAKKQLFNKKLREGAL